MDDLSKEQKWNEEIFKELGKCMDNISNVIQQLADTDKELAKRVLELERRVDLSWETIKTLLSLFNDFSKSKEVK